LTGYHVDFSNRLLIIAQCVGIVGCPSAFANVGGVTTNGVEASADWKFLPGFNWYNGLSYNRSTYNSNVQNGTVLEMTQGKTVVDTPDLTWKTQLGYHRDGFFGTVNGTFLGKRFFTYTNDQSVPDYFLLDLTAGYSWDRLGPVHDVRVQFNIDNLTDKRYVSTMGTNGYTFAGDNQTLQAGAPRAFFGTVSAKF
jgi:iron complex outermembrane receptor protein